MNKLFNSPALHDLALLAGRALLSAMFILGGWSKIGGYAGTAAYMASQGVPGGLLPLVILFFLFQRYFISGITLGGFK